MSITQVRACLFFLLQTPAVLAAAPGDSVPSLEGNGFRVGFDALDAAAVSWVLPEITVGRGRPRSLVGDDEPVASRHFRLDGQLAGRAVEHWARASGGWRWYRDGEELVFDLAPGNGSFVLEQRWRTADRPYRLHLEIRLNAGAEPLRGDPDQPLTLGLGPGIGEIPAAGLGIASGMYSFTELALRADGKVIRERVHAGQGEFRRTLAVGWEWLGLHSRYFALMVAPAGQMTPAAVVTARLPESAPGPDRQMFITELEITLADFALEPGETRTWAFDVFGGPKSRAVLRAGTPGLEQLLFPGLWQWMRALTLGILFGLTVIHGLVPNWGLAIILLAVLVRLALHPLAAWAMRAQQRFAAMQQKIRPEVDRIRRNYKGAEQSERLLELYERHGISPLAGLKPLLLVLIQIPVFIALFHLLGQTFELRSASFLWMETLAEPDRLFGFGRDLPFFGAHFNLLPVLMAVTTLLSIRLVHAPGPDSGPGPAGVVFGVAITVAFFLLLYPFPSGMVLYWTVANLLHLAHGLVKYSG